MYAPTLSEVVYRPLEVVVGALKKANIYALCRDSNLTDLSVKKRKCAAKYGVRIRSLHLRICARAFLIAQLHKPKMAEPVISESESCYTTRAAKINQLIILTYCLKILIFYHTKILRYPKTIIIIL